jgi:hypothetical protein
MSREEGQTPAPGDSPALELCATHGFRNRFQLTSEQAGRRRRKSFFDFVPERPPPRSGRNLSGAVEAGQGLTSQGFALISLRNMEARSQELEDGMAARG